MEPIKIVKCTETIDNWSRQEIYKDADLFKLLITPEDWTDDQVFLSDEGLHYFIDDLIGKRVLIGTMEFTVNE